MEEYGLSNFTCRDLMIASHLKCFNQDNFYIYLFLTAVLINWRKDIPLVQDEVLRLMGYKLNTVQFENIEDLESWTNYQNISGTVLVELSNKAVKSLTCENNKYKQDNFTISIEAYDYRNMLFRVKYLRTDTCVNSKDLYVSRWINKECLKDYLRMQTNAKNGTNAFMYLSCLNNPEKTLTKEFLISYIKTMINPDNNMLFDLVNRYAKDRCFFKRQIYTLRRCYYGSMFAFDNYVADNLITQNILLKEKWKKCLKEIIRERDKLINIIYMDALRNRVSTRKYGELLKKKTK